MKPLVALVAFSIAASCVFAEQSTVTPVQSAEVSAPEAKPVPPKAKKEEKPKPEKEPVIPGSVITRANGTFLGLEVVGGKFKLSFYDKKKKPMAVDVTSGLARWPNVRGPGDSRSPLNASGTALVAVRIAPPPYTYNVYITLLKGEGDEAKAVESYTVMFRG